MRWLALAAALVTLDAKAPSPPRPAVAAIAAAALAAVAKPPDYSGQPEKP